jgi:predicted class III extradiol MEMO1 family dioxygenase
VAKDYFLDHPSIDKVMKVVMALAQETYVNRDRLALVEKILDDKGVLTRNDLDHYQPSEEEQHDIKRRRDDFVASILRPIVEE